MDRKQKDINRFIDKEILKHLPKQEKSKEPVVKRSPPDDVLGDLWEPSRSHKPKRNTLTIGQGTGKFNLEIQSFEKEKTSVSAGLTLVKIVLGIALLGLLCLFVYLGYMNLVYTNEIGRYDIEQSGSSYQIRSSGDAEGIVLKKLGEGQFLVSTNVPAGTNVISLSVEGALQAYRASVSKAIGNSYGSTASLREYTAALRGDHILYAYVKNEILQFTFEFTDLNRYSGPDNVTIKVTDLKGKVISTDYVEDDSNPRNDSMRGQARSKTIRTKGLVEGTYKIIIETSGDTLITRIGTIQNKWVFKNHVFLADSTAYGLLDKPQTLYAPGSLSISTYHKEGFQNVTLGSADTVVINATNTQFNATSAGSVAATTGDLIIDSSGNIALDQTAYYDVAGWQNVLDNTNGTYLLAKMAPGSGATFIDIAQLPENGKLDIVLNIPGGDPLKTLSLAFLKKAT